jgi:hypothetical protein
LGAVVMQAGRPRVNAPIRAHTPAASDAGRILSISKRFMAL